MHLVNVLGAMHKHAYGCMVLRIMPFVIMFCIRAVINSLVVASSKHLDVMLMLWTCVLLHDIPNCTHSAQTKRRQFEFLSKQKQACSILSWEKAKYTEVYIGLQTCLQSPRTSCSKFAPLGSVNIQSEAKEWN